MEAQKLVFQMMDIIKQVKRRNRELDSVLKEITDKLSNDILVLETKPLDLNKLQSFTIEGDTSKIKEEEIAELAEALKSKRIMAKEELNKCKSINNQRLEELQKQLKEINAGELFEVAKIMVDDFHV